MLKGVVFYQLVRQSQLDSTGDILLRLQAGAGDGCVLCPEVNSYEVEACYFCDRLFCGHHASHKAYGDDLPWCCSSCVDANIESSSEEETAPLLVAPALFHCRVCGVGIHTNPQRCMF